MSDFFYHADAPDKRYRRLAAPEYDREVQARTLVEKLWGETAEYLDEDVKRCAPQEFLARFWEMYVAAALLQVRVPLVGTADRRMAAGGPDILMKDPPGFVEVTIATAGAGPDAVAEAESLVVREVPREQIILRLRAAIEEKHRKYQRYREREVLSASDAYVVAINGAAVPSTRGEPTLPWIVNAVLPFGRDVYHLDRETLEVVGRSFEPEYDILKKSGAAVGKDIFLSSDYEGISALVYGWADEYNNSPTPGSEFVVVHNPNALKPVPRGRLPGRLEFWIEDDRLRVHDRSKDDTAGSAA